MPYQDTMSFDDIWQVVNSKTEERMIYFIKFLERLKKESQLDLSEEAIISTAATMTAAATTELLILTLAGEVDGIKGLKE